MTEPARLTVGRWQPHAVPVLASSRDATDALLGELRAGGWSLAAWRAFTGRAGRRSWEQARAHPRAVAELTALHAAVALSRGHRRPVWPAVSWALAVTHLGLLGDRRSIGAATTLTLLRANLPALAAPQARWPPAVAALTDTLDGTLARAGQPTMFGGYADAVADTAFWTWYATRQPDRWVRAAGPAAWAVPAATVALAAFRGGRMVDPPRPRLLRSAAGLQVVLALRGLTPGPTTCRSLGLHGAQHGWGGPGVRAVSAVEHPSLAGPRLGVGVSRGCGCADSHQASSGVGPLHRDLC